MSAARGFVLVVSLQPLDATTTLFFSHLLRLAPDAIRVVRYGTRDVARLLSNASAVVFVRGLFEFGDLPACARVLGIPLYYFTDDNFIVLRERGGVAAKFVERYSMDNVRAVLERFTGVMVATGPLLNYFAEHRLHRHLVHFPPVLGERAHPAGHLPGAIRVAFFGGSHLHALFLGTVVPAIRRLARERAIILVAAGVSNVIAPSDGLSVIQHPYDESYSRGIDRLQAVGVDVFVHPVAPGVANNAYKNPHALISACVLNAIPVVSAAPPYDALRSELVALHCDDSEESWYTALASAAHDERLRSAMHLRLADYCAKQFGGAANLAALDDILSKHPSPPPARIVVRRCVATACMLPGLARRVVSRATRTAARRTTGAA